MQWITLFLEFELKPLTVFTRCLGITFTALFSRIQRGVRPYASLFRATRDPTKQHLFSRQLQIYSAN